MPGRDGTGPLGAGGTMTGRGAGYCAGNNARRGWPCVGARRGWRGQAGTGRLPYVGRATYGQDRILALETEVEALRKQLGELTK